MENLQSLLVCCKGVASDLSLMISEDQHDIFAFLGTALLERIPCNRNLLQYKILVGRMVNAGHSMHELQRVFKHDPRTMKNWGAALHSDEPEFIVQAFAGRGGVGKVTPAIVRYVKRNYRKYRRLGVANYRWLLQEDVLDYFGADLCGEMLRRLFREADQEDAASSGATGGSTTNKDEGVPDDDTHKTERHAPPAESSPDVTPRPVVPPVAPPAAPPPAESSPPHPPLEQATGCGVTPLDSDIKVDLERNRSPKSLGEDRVPPRIMTETCARMRWVHHAGLILFIGLFAKCRRFLPSNVDLQCQWIGQVLQGAVNIEQSRLVTAADLALFTGPVVKGINPQRNALHAMAIEMEIVIPIYEANSQLLDDGPGRGSLFYYDPHSKEYTGQLDVLNGWCGRRHATCKVIYLDAIHTQSGRPCFVEHYSAYYDLRERFFMTLTVFDRLFPADKRKDRTFVIDRGIYGLATISTIADSPDSLITWEKDYRGDGWTDGASGVTFVRHRTKNNAKTSELLT